MAGFTTVRDLGDNGSTVALRKAINEGWVPGPRIFTAGGLGDDRRPCRPDQRPARASCGAPRRV